MLRPLVGMDKDEITTQADAHRHAADLEHSGSGLLPAVHAAASRARGRGSSEVERAEAALPIDEMVDARRRRRPWWRTSDYRRADVSEVDAC